MGKGHFTCLGCNGYFAEGHWGGDGVAPTGGDSARYYYMRNQQPHKDRKALLVQVQNLLLALKGE